jgi:hypothetical protein
MASYLYAWGGSPMVVRDPDGDDGAYHIDLLIVGSEGRTLDGMLRQQINATKKRWAILWTRLTTAQDTNIMSALGLMADLAWQGPEASSATRVRTVGQVERWLDLYERYNVRVTLEEV